MPNIFRSKHKDRVSPQRTSVSSGTAAGLTTARVPGRDTGLPSPPRSPPGAMQPLGGAPGHYEEGDYQRAQQQQAGGGYGSYGAAQYRHDGSSSTLATSSSLASDGRARDSSAATSMTSGKDVLADADMHDAYPSDAYGGSGGHGHGHGGGAAGGNAAGYGAGYHAGSHNQAAYPSSSQYATQQPQPAGAYQQASRSQHQPTPTQAPQPPPATLQAQPSSQSHLLATPNTIQPSPTPSQGSSVTRKTTSRYALADFALIRTLGTGSFGRVHLARSRHNGRGYAIKVLAKDRVVRMKQVEHTNSEREMLDRVRHPFLVNLWGTFADARNLYMVMDFVAGGELFSLLRKSQRFPDPVAKFFGAEVALALDYLHSMDIIYRDLKPENILLGADGHIKITDFGFAKHVPDITWTLCGTPDYLAPEIVQSKGYNKSVDWYALGVLVFEMLAGYPPFFTEDPNPMRLYEKIIAGKIRYPSYFTPEAKDLLKALLTADLTKRFGNLASGSGDIFRHAWFAEVDWERLYRKEIPAPYVPRVESEWDASNFDQYPEVDIAEYGQPGSDQHAGLFPYW